MTAHLQTAPTRSFFAPALDAAWRFGRYMVNNSDGMRCKREADLLFQMSDAELAKLGLTRDRIIHHAFARYLAV